MTAGVGGLLVWQPKTASAAGFFLHADAIRANDPLSRGATATAKVNG